MFIRNYIGDTIMDYALYLGILAVLGCGGLYFIRQRIKRRRKPQIDIPDFLRKDGANSGDGGLGDPDTEWTEIFPVRKRK